MSTNILRLYCEIDSAKNELYSAMDRNKNLTHDDVCFLSSKLDKLIVEYQLKACVGKN